MRLTRISRTARKFALIAGGFIAISQFDLLPEVALGAQPSHNEPLFFGSEFHFSNAARDARFRQLRNNVEQAMTEFQQADSAALDAVAVPGPPPGSPAWLQARALVNRAIQMRRPVREAAMMLAAFLRQARPGLPADEAEAVEGIMRSNDSTLQATSDRLVDLLGKLAGIRLDHWPP